MTHILSMHTWVSLTSEQRNMIRQVFNIPRSSHVIVNDGRIETDGTTPSDFEHLTVEKMKGYLHSESVDFHKLFDMVLERINLEISGVPIQEVPIEVEQPEIINANPVVHAKSKKSKQK